MGGAESTCLERGRKVHFWKPPIEQSQLEEQEREAQLQRELEAAQKLAETERQSDCKFAWKKPGHYYNWHRGDRAGRIGKCIWISIQLKLECC